MRVFHSIREVNKMVEKQKRGKANAVYCVLPDGTADVLVLGARFPSDGSLGFEVQVDSGEWVKPLRVYQLP